MTQGMSHRDLKWTCGACGETIAAHRREIHDQKHGFLIGENLWELIGNAKPVFECLYDGCFVRHTLDPSIRSHERTVAYIPNEQGASRPRKKQTAPTRMSGAAVEVSVGRYRIDWAVPHRPLIVLWDGTDGEGLTIGEAKSEIRMVCEGMIELWRNVIDETASRTHFGIKYGYDYDPTILRDPHE